MYLYIYSGELHADHAWHAGCPARTSALLVIEPVKVARAGDVGFGVLFERETADAGPGMCFKVAGDQLAAVGGFSAAGVSFAGDGDGGHDRVMEIGGFHPWR